MFWLFELEDRYPSQLRRFCVAFHANQEGAQEDITKSASNTFNLMSRRLNMRGRVSPLIFV
jgi:hypothetical protein